MVVNDGMMQVQQWVHREGAGCVRDGQRRRALLRTSMEALSGQCDWTHGNGQFVAFEQGSWTHQGGHAVASREMPDDANGLQAGGLVLSPPVIEHT